MVLCFWFSCFLKQKQLRVGNYPTCSYRFRFLHKSSFQKFQNLFLVFLKTGCFQKIFLKTVLELEPNCQTSVLQKTENKNDTNKHTGLVSFLFFDFPENTNNLIGKLFPKTLSGNLIRNNPLFTFQHKIEDDMKKIVFKLFIVFVCENMRKQKQKTKLIYKSGFVVSKTQ